MNKIYLLLLVICSTLSLKAQQSDSTQVYKKRVLDAVEIDILGSYYTQDGDNAAVTGGRGTESLQNITGTVIVSIPLNEDDVLSIDAGVSAYTSASSSNINPFSGKEKADPFVVASGESQSDALTTVSAGYSHSSDDRNTVFSGNLSVASEYDYTSFGGGFGIARLFNDKNTEISAKVNVFLDKWTLLYPMELRSSFNPAAYPLTGNTNYTPRFRELSGTGRNSYAFGLGFSQILSKRIQGALAADFIYQTGLLSTPFQRVYFGDVEDTFIEKFHLADDIERLPDTRFKKAVGGRLNVYINEFLTARTFYRYYTDDWGINSHTASIELPIKLWMGKFTLYPSYRFYNQTAADYFQPYNQHLSTADFYTSDYDLSKYTANQFGFGVSYTDVLETLQLWKISLKSIDVKTYYYKRDSAFYSFLFTVGAKFSLQ